jgi:adenosylmethionine-8-amino-7-oxononanoate aminotransferase
MDVVGSQRGAVVHGGTYTANLIGLSAAQATLAILSDTQALHTVHQAGQQVKSLLSRVFTRAGLAHAFAGPPSMLGIHFTPHVPQTYRDWRKTDSQLYNLFAWELISRGVMLEPDSREPWFFCEAHALPPWPCVQPWTNPFYKKAKTREWAGDRCGDSLEFGGMSASIWVKVCRFRHGKLACVIYTPWFV